MVKIGGTKMKVEKRKVKKYLDKLERKYGKGYQLRTDNTLPHMGTCSYVLYAINRDGTEDWQEGYTQLSDFYVSAKEALI